MRFLLSLLVLCPATICRADIIYSNLGPGDMFGAGTLVIGSAAASYLGSDASQNGQSLFQSNGSYLVSSFTLGVDYYPLGTPVSALFNAYLYSNIQIDGYEPVGGFQIFNQPGAEIADIGQAIQSPTSPGLVTLNPSAPIYLTNSLYWIILTPNNPITSVVWDNNSFEVDGTLLTPEPATFGLLTCALAGLTAIRKRHPTR